MEKLNCNIIVCGPAVGKTYLAEKDNRFIDLDEAKAIYKYGLENLTREEKESGKLNRGTVVRHDSTNFAINKLLEAIENNKVVLLSYNEKILKYIIDNKIEYCLVYASQDSSEEYKERMAKRGNNSNFIEEMTNEDKWQQFYVSNKNDSNATYKIELKKGQYLSDIKDVFTKVK